MPVNTPDISKCLGTSCKKRDTCLRYTIPAREKYQAWIHMAVSIPNTEKCKFYWSNEE